MESAMTEEESQHFLLTHLAKFIVGTIAVLVFLFIAIFIANYRFPSFFDPPKAPNNAPGWTFVSTIVAMGDQMFDNWLPNDIIWPTAFMDNRPNYQLGQLKMLTYSVFRLKEDLSRLRSSDAMDSDCAEAYTLLNNDPLKWAFPSAESRFTKAMDYLKAYRLNLEENKARFSPRADNLSDLLKYYVSLLGSLNAELTKAPGELRLKRADVPPIVETVEPVPAAKDAPAAPQGSAPPAATTPPGAAPPPAATQATAAQTAPAPAAPKASTRPEAEIKRVPYGLVDDNFYQAQGAAYVLREMMAAIKMDFQYILEVKKATDIVDDIILTLDQSQFEPLIVLNGDIGSITANHSMELHSILENARQKINNLIEMISQ
jgi:hypothetical protein